MKEIFELIKTGNNDILETNLRDNPSLAASKTEQGISLLQFAAYHRNKEAIEIIRVYLNKLDIFEAASIGDGNTLLHLIEKDPDQTNAYSVDGFTPLGLASFFGHTELVKILIDNGAKPNIAANNQFKVTPLHSACSISNYDIAEILIKNGADVNAKQMQNVTPLHSAAHNGQIRLVKLLIDNGADINSKMENGQTPLFMAEEKEFKEIIELLRKNGGQ
jgi:uncharacterized protein